MELRRIGWALYEGELDGIAAEVYRIKGKERQDKNRRNEYSRLCHHAKCARLWRLMGSERG